jgi:hypothetical protein
VGIGKKLVNMLEHSVSKGDQHFANILPTLQESCTNILATFYLFLIWLVQVSWHHDLFFLLLTDFHQHCQSLLTVDLDTGTESFHCLLILIMQHFDLLTITLESTSLNNTKVINITVM